MMPSIVPHREIQGIATGLEGNCSCDCNAGWYGGACSQLCTRASYCNGHGVAVEDTEKSTCTNAMRVSLEAPADSGRGRWQAASSLVMAAPPPPTNFAVHLAKSHLGTAGCKAHQGAICQQDVSKGAAVLWRCLSQTGPSSPDCQQHKTPGACNGAGCEWTFQLLDNCTELTDLVCGKHGSAVLLDSQTCEFECECSQGWRGSSCSDIDFCDATYCNNHGNTSGVVGACSCSCFTGWLGETCEQRCSREDFCGGHGKAIFSDSACSCKCDAGFFGPTCSIGCSREFCSGHGVGLQRGSACDCECEFGWTGSDCNISIGAKSEDLLGCNCSVAGANSSVGQLLCEPSETNQGNHSGGQCWPITWECWQEGRHCQERPADCQSRHPKFAAECRKLITIDDCMTQEMCEWQVQPAVIWSCFSSGLVSGLPCDELTTQPECAQKLGSGSIGPRWSLWSRHPRALRLQPNLRQCLSLQLPSVPFRPLL